MATIDTFRDITGKAILNFNENPQVCFFNVFPLRGSHAAAKKLVKAGFNAYVGLDNVIICDLFNVIDSTHFTRTRPQ